MTAKYRNALPQLSGDMFLTDAGIETDLIFNHGIEIREFAAHTLLPDRAGRQAVIDYLRGFLTLSAEMGTGFILDSQTWKAHSHWADDLGATTDELRQTNHDAMAFIAGIRDGFSSHGKPIILNGVVGPRGDAYAPEDLIRADDAHRYHTEQVSWLAETDADLITAMTFTQAGEAIGITRAARDAGIPIVISFTVETDGNLPTGQPLAEAIDQVDRETDQGPAYYMVNCAHPDHFSSRLADQRWARRIRGIRCNASRMSHDELDNSDTLDDGNPHELARQYCEMKQMLPWLNVFGGCCGSDLRHVTQIARALSA